MHTEKKIISHLNTLNNVLDNENLILLGYFHVKTEEKHVWIYEYV